jgi:hypothetical protein
MHAEVEGGFAATNPRAGAPLWDDPTVFGQVVGHHLDPFGCAGPTETDLFVDLIPEDAVKRRGDRIEASYYGRTTSTGDKRVRLYFGDLDLFDSGVITEVGEWELWLTICWTTDDHMLSSVKFFGPSSGVRVVHREHAGILPNRSRSLRLTGQADASDGVMVRLGLVETRPDGV